MKSFLKNVALDFDGVIVDSEPLPLYASSDYRLGNFDAITVGIKYGWRTNSGHDLGLRLEYYMQDGEVPANQLIGNQLQRDMYPGLEYIYQAKLDSQTRCSKIAKNKRK